MRKYLGDILLEKGYLKPEDLERALSYQARKVLGAGAQAQGAAGFLIDVARTKYNNRDEFYLGRILTELRLVPEERLREALEIQARIPEDRSTNRLETLVRIARRINDNYNLIDLLNRILVSASELAEAEAASLIVHDHARGALVILMPTGPLAEAVRELEIPPGRGIAGWVYAHGKGVIANDAQADSRFYPGIDQASGFTSRSILCVPLTVKDKRLGAIEVVNRRPPGSGFTSADQQLLQLFSDQAAIAIENTRLTLALSEADREMSLQKANVAASERVRAASLVSEALLAEMRRSFVPLEGYARRLREAVPDERVAKYSGYLDAEMNRLSTRAEQLLHFLRDDWRAVARRTEVRDLLRDLASGLWVDSRLSGIAVETSVEGDPAIDADPELLLVSLRELFRNSRDAQPDGGTFSVSARRRNGDVLLTVRDAGPGLPPDRREELFEPFVASGRPGCAGLGLAIARRIVELHHGTIRPVEGQPGATFEISLPAAGD